MRRSSPAGPLVLVVEMDARIRSVLTRTLEQEGCRVLPACDCRTAILLVAALDLPVDLVITTATLPYPEGHSLIDELARRDHYPPMLFISSQAAPPARPGLPEPLRPQPFSPVALKAAVQHLLGPRRGETTAQERA